MLCSGAGVGVDGFGGVEGAEGGEPPPKHTSLLQSTGLLTTGLHVVAHF